MTKVGKMFLTFFFGLLVVLICLIPDIYANHTEKNVSGVVTDKYVKNNNDKSDYYMVIKGVPYKNTDSMFIGKFNSADIQAKVKVGDHVKAKAYGFRNSFFSEFRNIREIKEDGE